MASDGIHHSSPVKTSRRVDLFDEFDATSCSSSMEISQTASALETLQTFLAEKRCGTCGNFAVFEQLRSSAMHRIIEDHEILADIEHTWQTEPDNEHNRFVVRQDYCKYEVFRNPKQFFPDGMLNLPSDRYDTLAGEHPAAQNAFLRNLILSTSWIPEVEGSLCIRDKKTWRKQYFILRPSGLYTSSKQASRDPKHLSLICSLDKLNIYQVDSGKRILGSPTDSVICLRGTLDDSLFELFLAAEDGEMLRNWMIAFRLRKYGDKLKENYLSAVQADQMQTAAENIKDLAIQEKTKSLVPMDFSGDCGRIVNDQQEAVDALITEFQGWKKRRTDRCTDSPSSPTSLPLHLTEPWYHGTVTREEATRLLANQGLVDGTFLVRKSRSDPRSYVLSLSYSGKVRHHRIARVRVTDAQVVYSLDDGKTKFADLMQLIEFYHLNVGALGCKLTYSVRTNLGSQR